jgi:hypothetical protein
MLYESLKSAVRAVRRQGEQRFLTDAVAKADALLVSYPKCGRTWLRFTLSNYFADVFNLGIKPDLVTTFQIIPNMDKDPVRGIPAFQFASARPALPQILVSHRDYTRAQFLDRPAIFLVRDPRDVVVSAYFHATRHKHRYEGTIGDFLVDEKQGLAAYVRYLNGWATGLADHPHHIASYEQMSADPEQTLRAILTFLGTPVDDTALANAITASRFDAMRSQEKQEGIPGHDYDRSDDESMRMRKGKAGGFSEYLTPEQSASVLAYCHTHLNARARQMVALTGVTLDTALQP